MKIALHPFATLVETCRVELAAIVPQLDDVDDAGLLNSMAAFIALSRCRLKVEQRDNEIAARLICRPAPFDCPPADMLLAHLAEAIVVPLREAGKCPEFGLDKWLNHHGFLDLVINLVKLETPLDAVNDLARYVADATRQLHEHLTKLASYHIVAILNRDLNYAGAFRQTYLTSGLHWLLAPARSGQPERKTIIGRRMQALSVYGAIASLLMTPKITNAIDRGQALNPLLTRTLGVSDAHLRTLQGVRSAQQAMTSFQDVTRSITTLLLHEVPLNQWPKGTEWDTPLWNVTSGETIFRPDYVGIDPERRDAINALREDLLYPLAASRAARAGLLHDNQVRQFVQGFYLLTCLGNGAEHRLWLRALREAVIGPRGVKSFHEAITLWHRRAATLAALRHEQKTDKPGWPALCPSWTAPDGTHQIVPLTNADDLVAEGHALDHCVGGYYPQCRRGDTQIFSLRRGDERLATLELILNYGPEHSLTIVPGQFKSRANSKPQENLSLIVRGFLDALRHCQHPTAGGELLVHHRQRQRDGDYASRSEPMPLSHARKAWPLYHSLLPKGSPDSYDQWCEQSGLAAAFDRMIDTVSRPFTRV